MKRTFLGLLATVTLAVGLLAMILVFAGPAATAGPEAITTIYDIQYTTVPGDGSYPSLLEGQVVTTTGVVYATYTGRGFCIADASGPWHGVYVYYPSGTMPSVGDEVQVVAEVVEYYGLTELGNYATYTVLSSGNSVYPPQVVTTAEIPWNDANTSEPYESVFVEIRDIEVTAEVDVYYVWDFTDASGGTSKADDWGYRLEPSVGDRFSALRGALIYWYGYVVQPRNADDVVEGQPIEVSKAAPAEVLPGERFTYTISAQNLTGDVLSNAVLTDALPLSLQVGELSDGGVHLGGNVVSWTIPSLADGVLVSRTAVVTAPAQVDVVVNEDYGLWASNWPTRATGSSVTTLVSGPGEVIPIHLIQGDDLTSPVNGYADISIEGVVVGDFQNTSTELGGFYVQEEDEDADGDPATSEGIWVYDNGFGVDVEDGDVVLVRGDVNEHDGQTELSNIDTVSVSSSGLAVTVSHINLPVSAIEVLERYEGMMVSSEQSLYATEHYNLGRYGEVWVSAGERLLNPTNVITPGAPAIALQDLNDRSRLLVDDGSSVQNPPSVPYLGPDNTLRLGDLAGELEAVLGEGAGYYRLQPTDALAFTRENNRSDAPEAMNGAMTVASFNVLNYFNGDGQGGGFPTPRGASTYAEFVRQRTKIITAVLSIDADVIGLMEIENDGYGQYSAIQDLVNGLNDETAPGTYDFIDPSVAQIGTDAIAVGIIYKATTATPIGNAAILDSSVDPTFIDTKNRPVLAQTFDHMGTGERLTIAVNHLKSKGSPCTDVGDPDMGDGQGNCNLTRTSAAEAEVAWLLADPTGSGDSDALIIGDLNAYAMEDPITAIKAGGYTDLVNAFEGAEAYSYVYAGQAGYLDHGLSNASLTPQVAGATVWHINADEPRALDYQDYNPPYLYAPDAFRASDHDPVVVSLFAPDLAISKGVTPAANVAPGGIVTYTIELDNTGMSDALGVEMVDALPNEVHFAGWLEQPAGASQADDVVSWTGDVMTGMPVSLAFTATVGTNSAFYGQTITNTASFSSTNAGSDSASAAFDIIGAPALTIVKEVTPVANVPLGSIVTYSILLANSGEGAARGVIMSDALPIEVSFGGWIVRHQAEVVSDTITWSGDIGGQKDVQIVFTATVGSEPSLSGQTVTNTAEYASAINGSGSDDATFIIASAPDRTYIYLPVVMRSD